MLITIQQHVNYNISKCQQCKYNMSLDDNWEEKEGWVDIDGMELKKE